MHEFWEHLRGTLFKAFLMAFMMEGRAPKETGI